MARSKNEIFNALLDSKDSDPVLSTLLTSGSKASFYQSLFNLVAEHIGNFELEFDAFVLRIENIFNEKQVQTIGWWYFKSLSFQLGDIIIVDGAGQTSYSVIDEDKQIVDFAAISPLGNSEIQIRCASSDANGNPTPLTSTELVAFRAYFEDVKPPNVTVTIISVAGDEIKLIANAIVDAQIINTSDGNSISDPSVKPIEVAIINYISTFQSNEFGNTFRVNKLIQSVLEVTGVIDFTISSFEKKSGSDTNFTDVLSTDRRFNTLAGYVRIADGFDLSANITYEV